jgi:DNA-binding transcriptional ArsR family regulator
VRFVARHGESWCAQVIGEAGLPMTKPAFSRHLRILREAGIVTKRIQGARGYMSLRKDDLDRRFPGLMASIVSAENEPVAELAEQERGRQWHHAGDAARLTCR